MFGLRCLHFMILVMLFALMALGVGRLIYTEFTWLRVFLVCSQYVILVWSIGILWGVYKKTAVLHIETRIKLAAIRNFLR